MAIGWLDHLTYGGFNTAVGVPLGLSAMLYNRIVDKTKMRIGFDSTGQQLVVEDGSWIGRTHSIGAIHEGSGADAHEAAHGKQSGTLGIGYFPFIGIAYLIEGFDTGHAEQWADQWQHLGKTMVNSHPLVFRMQTDKFDNKNAVRLGANFIVMERNSRLRIRGTNGDYLTTSYKYGEIGAHVSIAHPDGPCSKTAPVKLEETLFQKNFLAEWRAISQATRLLLDSKQETGKLVVDLDYGRLDARALSQQLGLGASIGDPEEFSVDLIGRGTAGVKGIWYVGKENKDTKSPGLTGTIGVSAEIRLHLLDKFEIFGKKEHEWGTGHYSLDMNTIGGETPLLFTARAETAPPYENALYAPHDKANSLLGGVQFQAGREKFPSATGNPSVHRIQMTVFTLGGRF